MGQSLAVKYRPSNWDALTEQEEIKKILKWQIENNDIKGAYLFVGGAGTGKTTSARIFANEINHGIGNPIELDAASHNSVQDIRDIEQQARMKSLTGEYKVFILDEVHSLSSSAWQAMLKILEEPPQRTVFIMCTTEANKVPKTILSRAQRYQFNRISQKGIIDRLRFVCNSENMANKSDTDDFIFTKNFANNWTSGETVSCTIVGDDSVLVDDVAMVSTSELLKHGYFSNSIRYDEDAISYIAKVADGHMRDALTLLDKCLAYSHDLTMSNVIDAIGATDFDTMIRLSKAMLSGRTLDMLTITDKIYNDGKDFKLFVRSYLSFMLDVCTYNVTHSFDFIKIPNLYKNDLDYLVKYDCNNLLSLLMKLNSEIKYDSEPKILTQAYYYQFCTET